jgi:hypothetical protein
MNQLTKVEQAVGKTVSGAAHRGSQVLIAFSDGSWLALDTDYAHDETPDIDVKADVNNLEKWEWRKLAVSVGLLSKELVDEMEAEERRKSDEHRKAYKRRQYEELKREFDQDSLAEPKPTP